MIKALVKIVLTQEEIKEDKRKRQYEALVRCRAKNGSWRSNNLERSLILEKSIREKNADKIKKANIKWRKKNPEKCSLYMKTWRNKNEEKALKQLKEWRNKNIERCREVKKAWNKKHPESTRDSACRRRARLAKVVIEKFSSVEIYNRDNWVCGICGMKVDPSVKAPDKMSASIDHVIPLALGGAHSRENTQIAHLGCNISAGARIKKEKKGNVPEIDRIIERERKSKELERGGAEK